MVKTAESGYTRRDTVEGWIDDPEPISADVAKKWVAQHSLSMDELRQDLGEKEFYGSDDVLHWLGY